MHLIDSRIDRVRAIGMVAGRMARGGCSLSEYRQYLASTGISDRLMDFAQKLFERNSPRKKHMHGAVSSVN